MTSITDLYGRPVEDGVIEGVIFIETKNQPELLKLMAVERGVSIWKVDRTGVDRLLTQLRLPVSHYSLLGDLIFHRRPPVSFEIPLIYLHPRLAQPADRFERVTEFAHGSLWRPITETGVELGLVFSEQRPRTGYATVSEQLISESYGESVEIGRMNEFYHVGYQQPMRSLNRLRLISLLDRLTLDRPSDPESDPETEQSDQSDAETEIIDRRHWQNLYGSRVVLRVPDNPWFDRRSSLRRSPPPVQSPPTPSLPIPTQPTTEPTTDLSPTTRRRVAMIETMLFVGVTMLLLWQLFRIVRRASGSSNE